MSNYHNDKDGPPGWDYFSSVGEDEFKGHVEHSQCPKCKNISIKNLRYIIGGHWYNDEAEWGGNNFHTFCQCVECEHIWYAIHANAWEFVYDFDSQGHVETREPVVKSKSVEYYPPLPEDGYISLESIDELHRLSSSSKFDLRRLARLCEEINSNFRNKNYIAVILLTRALLDHIPPILGYSNFKEVVNNYKGESRRDKPTSFQKVMEHLHESAREMGNIYAHDAIKEKVLLPTENQINYRNDLSLLLAEIIIILTKAKK